MLIGSFLYIVKPMNLQLYQELYKPAYSYGYGGQEKDNEVSGEGNSYTAQYWQYDSRLGRRWNRDPITYPWQSAYSTNNNNPIVYTDPTGLYGIDKAKRKRKRAVKRYGEHRVSEVYQHENKGKKGYGFNTWNFSTIQLKQYACILDIIILFIV